MPRTLQRYQAEKTDFGSEKVAETIRPTAVGFNAGFKIVKAATKFDLKIEGSADCSLGQLTRIVGSTVAEVVGAAVIGSALRPVGLEADTAMVREDPKYHSR